MDTRVVRRAALAGVVGPLGFLLVAFGEALARPRVLGAQGWRSWPSDMALGGAAGLPQIGAFLLLAICYPVFALGALRPETRNRAAWGGFLGVAAGDLLLAFPTDGPGAGVSWHGEVHLAGVILVTAATAVAAAGVTAATWRRRPWRPWRRLGAPAVALGVAIGALAGFDQGWAKVVYVIGVTAPVPLVAALVRGGVELPSALQP